VVLCVEGSIDAGMLERLGRSRCDEVIVTPAPGEELFHKIAHLLGLPRRTTRRMDVELRAEMESGAVVQGGRVLDLSPDGARMTLERPLLVGQEVRLRITTAEGAPVVARAKVVWMKPGEGSLGLTCGVQFVGLGDPARTMIEDLSLWEIHDLPDGIQQVILQGDFREHTDLSRLAPRLSGRVEFDLSWVRYINSSGVRHWVNLLRALRNVTDVSFVRCSVAFVTQASMVPEVVGSGRIESFHAPYACEACDLEEERLMQSAVLMDAGRWPPDLPVFACPRCRGTLEFDDLPSRFLAFLTHDARFKKTP
jgi:hypothetical protein